MVILNDDELKMPNRQSSKGNQLKFLRDDIWYKADYLGYEGLVEYTVSKLLRYSDLKDNEYVDYETDGISYNGQVFNACRSRDFTDGRQLITLERLFKQAYGQGLNKVIYSIPDHEERLKTMVDQVIRLTGIEDFGQYMCKTLAIDALFLNEDRHTHNLAVLVSEQGEYSLSPIFDNGAGLLSDTTMEYPLSQDHIKLMERVKPKTFCDDFFEQLSIAEKLYGRCIKFDFGYNDVCGIVNAAESYGKEVRTRVIDVVMQTKRTYGYLFAG